MIYFLHDACNSYWEIGTRNALLLFQFHRTSELHTNGISRRIYLFTAEKSCDPARRASPKNLEPVLSLKDHLPVQFKGQKVKCFSFRKYSGTGDFFRSLMGKKAKKRKVSKKKTPAIFFQKKDGGWNRTVTIFFSEHRNPFAHLHYFENVVSKRRQRRQPQRERPDGKEMHRYKFTESDALLVDAIINRISRQTPPPRQIPLVSVLLHLATRGFWREIPLIVTE